MQIPRDTLTKLEQYNQQHLFQFWDLLRDEQHRALLNQIDRIDFNLLGRLIEQRNASHDAAADADLAVRAEPPQQLVRLPRSEDDRQHNREAVAAGEELLRSGKTGAILVAGGQGSRLGFDSPKGLFPIGPVSERSLFQVLCEQLLARSRRSACPIPYFIMTSEATHAPTVAYFEEHNFFGLGKENVYFFQQAALPAIEDSSHRILMENPARIATSPDGHGGMLSALQRAGLIEVLRERGVEHLYYHQVDNPTAVVCDPEFLGHHVLAGSDLTTKVVAKTSPEEKMGVLAAVDGQTRIIEYSDLSPDQAERTQPDGTLVFWAGNTAIHAFRREFLERLLTDELSLPFHIAHKKVPHLDAEGNLVEPSKPNANKFERFIFDALPHARMALVVEADRAREFNPVKNAEGSDSPATSRAALARLAREWITAVGGTVAEGVTVEISPLYALDQTDLQAKLPHGTTLDHDTILK